MGFEFMGFREKGRTREFRFGKIVLGKIDFGYMCFREKYHSVKRWRREFRFEKKGGYQKKKKKIH